jgi:hypothetical protein
MDVLRNNSWPHSVRRKNVCFEIYWPPVNYYKLLNMFLYKYEHTNKCIYFPWLFRDQRTKQQSIWLVLSRWPVHISSGMPTSSDWEFLWDFWVHTEMPEKCLKLGPTLQVLSHSFYSLSSYHATRYRHTGGSVNKTQVTLDFRLPPQSRWYLRSSGILHSVEWQFLTDELQVPRNPRFLGIWRCDR